VGGGREARRKSWRERSGIDWEGAKWEGERTFPAAWRWSFGFWRICRPFRGVDDEGRSALFRESVEVEREKEREKLAGDDAWCAVSASLGSIP